MEFIKDGPFLLLVCVSVLRITGTAGSYDYGHPLHKRQADSGRCEQAVQAEVCENGFSQDAAIQLLQCGVDRDALTLQNKCRSNSFGVHCGALDDNDSRNLQLLHYLLPRMHGPPHHLSRRTGVLPQHLQRQLMKPLITPCGLSVRWSLWRNSVDQARFDCLKYAKTQTATKEISGSH